jgi:hypothetical protein
MGRQLAAEGRDAARLVAARSCPERSGWRALPRPFDQEQAHRREDARFGRCRSLEPQKPRTKGPAERIGLTETTRNAMPSGRFDQIKVTFEIVVMSPRIL